MIVLAIENIITDAASLDDLKHTLVTKYRLAISEYEVSGKRVIHVNRSKDSQQDFIQDECSNLIIDEDMTIISRNVEKLYPIEDGFCLLDINEDEPVIVEEQLPGKQIILSRFYSTYLLSTEKDIHGRDPIIEGGPRCNDIVMHAFNTTGHLSGLDTLFAEDLPESTCWCFQLVPKNTFNIDKPEDYELVLLNAINTNTNVELSITQLDNIGEQFGIRTPVRRYAYGMKRIKEVSEILYSMNPSILGTVVTEIKHENSIHSDTQRGKLSIVNITPWKAELNRTAKLILKHQCHNPEIKGEPGLVNMLELLQDNYSDILEELTTLYIDNEKARTRRIFASKIKHHPFAAALFALKDNKISGLLQMHKVIRPYHLLKYVESRDKSTFKTTLDDYKETVCRLVKK